MTASSSGSRASERSTPRAASAASSRPRTGITSTAGASSDPGCRSGAAGPSVQRSMMGLATSRRSRTSVCVPVGMTMRRPVAAADTGTPSWRAAWTTASAAPSVTPGCSVISMPPAGTSHDPSWSNGSARKAPSRARAWSSRSPSTNTTSATSAGPSSGRPSEAAPTATAVARGSVSRDRTVNLWIGRGPGATAPTLRGAFHRAAALNEKFGGRYGVPRERCGRGPGTTADPAGAGASR